MCPRCPTTLQSIIPGFRHYKNEEFEFPLNEFISIRTRDRSIQSLGTLWEFNLQLYVEYEPRPVFRWPIGGTGENPGLTRIRARAWSKIPPLTPPGIEPWQASVDKAKGSNPGWVKQELKHSVHLFFGYSLVESKRKFGYCLSKLKEFLV